MTRRTGPGHARNPGNLHDCIDLRLYVVNKAPRCVAAYENLVRICERWSGGPYRITVIDLQRNPEMAREDGITAIPTLIRIPRTPGTRKIIGTLADTRRVISELGLAGGDRFHGIPAAM